MHLVIVCHYRLRIGCKNVDTKWQECYLKIIFIWWVYKKDYSNAYPHTSSYPRHVTSFQFTISVLQHSFLTTKCFFQTFISCCSLRDNKQNLNCYLLFRVTIKITYIYILYAKLYCIKRYSSLHKIFYPTQRHQQ